MVIFRKAMENELPELRQLLIEAKQFMRDNGIYQWTKEYPDSEDILEDIRREELFLLKEKGKVVCMGAFTQTPLSENLVEAEGHNWFIKRLVTKKSELGRGYGSVWIRQCISQFARAEDCLYSCTNHTNLPMQRLFEKALFTKKKEVTIAGRESLGIFYVYERKIGRIDE